MADAQYMRTYMSVYRETNADVVRSAQKTWRDKNKARNTEYMREYRARKKAEKLANQND